MKMVIRSNPPEPEDRLLESMSDSHETLTKYLMEYYATGDEDFIMLAERLLDHQKILIRRGTRGFPVLEVPSELLGKVSSKRLFDGSIELDVDI